MNVLLLFALICSALACAQVSADDKVFVCYYGSWAVYRPDDGKFDVEQIDPYLCTHVIYGFAGLGYDNKIVALDPWNDLPDNYGKGAYLRFTNLTKQNPHLKPLLAIGGWNEGSQKYSDMVKDPNSRHTFVQSVVPFLTKYGFQGLDIDWEYPTERGGAPGDKENDILLLKELREEFDKSGMLLTAAVSAGIPTIASAYDIPEMSKYLDHIHVMTYDFHGSWEQFTGINTPLYPKPEDNEFFTNFTIDRAIHFWLDQGAPKDKLVLGLALYGHSYTLQHPENHGINDTAPQPGQAGPYTRQAGTIGYNEVCEIKHQSGWTSVYDDTYVIWYMYKDNQWFDYDDTDTLQVKVQYLMDLGLKGGMVWSIETDDFKGKCGKGANPLLVQINAGLGL